MDSDNNIILKHSKVGIASIICMSIAIVLLVVGFIFAGIGEVNHNEGLLMVGGLFILLCLLVACGGVVTGIIGCCLSNCKKVLAIVGLSVNACLFLLVVILMVIGSAM